MVPMLLVTRPPSMQVNSPVHYYSRDVIERIWSHDSFSGKSALTKHNLALAYNAGDMIIHGTANDSKVDLLMLIDFFSHLR